MSWGISKKYVTIVRVENPNGAVTVNEQYLPLGTCRRYERGKLNGSVMYPTNDRDDVREELKKHASVKNMVCHVSIYKLKGKYKETDMSHHHLLERWIVKEGRWIELKRM